MKKTRFTKIIALCLSAALLLSGMVFSASAAETAVRYWGDVNNDQKVNSQDALMILKHAVEITELTDEQKAAADYDGGGIINSADALVVLKMAVEILPLEELTSEEVPGDVDYSKKTVTMQSIKSQIRLLGRTVAEGKDSIRFDWAASGFEIALYCQGDVTFNMRPDGKIGRIGVVVDGDEENIKMITTVSGDHEYTAAEDLPKGKHTIKIVKIQEAKEGCAVMNSITFSGELAERPADKELKIEFYGDSITSGYGSEESRDTAGGNSRLNLNSNGYTTYAGVAARALDADFSVISASGYGLIASFSGGHFNIPDVSGYSDWAGKQTWDFKNNPVDIVVVNLGTNDGNAGADKPTQTEFKAKVVDFTQELRGRYPDASIIWVSGMMGSNSLQKTISGTVTEINKTDANVYYASLPRGINGVDGHPSTTEQARAGRVLTQFIQTKILEDK